MRKYIKYFAAILVLLTVMTVFAACGQSPVEKMSAAFDAMEEINAVDMSMLIKARAGNERMGMSMRLKVAGTDQNQAAYIRVEDNNSGSVSTVYFSEGYICEDYGYDYNIYQADYTDFISENQVPPVSIDIDKLIKKFTVTETKDGALDKYTLAADEAAFKEIFEEIFGDMSDGFYGLTDSLKANFKINIWLDRSTSLLKKIEYNFDFKVDDTDCNLNMTIDINAVNENVSIDIPVEVAEEIARYKNACTVTVVAEPYDYGSVYGAGTYREGVYVSVSASPFYGYTFEGWYQDGELVSQSYYYSFYMPGEDISLTARFAVEEPTYYIWTNTEPYDYGNAWGPYSAKEGDTVTMTANPYQGYVFLGWYDNGIKVSGDTNYVFTMPGRGMNLTAKFGQFAEIYEDTNDGVVKYYDLGGYKDVIFDSNTNKFVVSRTNAIDIYSEDMTKQKTLSFLITPDSISADNGILAIGFGEARQIHLYNLTDYSEIKKIQTSIGVYELVLDGDMLIYTSNGQWCNLIFYNIGSSKIVKDIGGFYAPLLTINRADHIVYLAETGISSSALMYFNSQTGEILFESGWYQFGYNYERVQFDGKFVHFYGGTYDRLTGELFSANNLNKHYNTLTGFMPSKTVYDSDDLAFVFGTKDIKPEVGIYNNNDGQYIYRFNYVAVSLERFGENKYFARNIGGDFVAIIDMSLIPDGFEENIAESTLKGEVTEAGGIKTLQHFEAYKLSVMDSKYIYLINETTFRLCVYDITTLNEVYSERFLLKPACMDAYGGRLAIGFGDGRQFRVYNTDDWSFSTVKADECVFSIAIYEDRIFYLPVDQHCSLYIYDLTEKKHITYSVYFSAYYPTIAINREDGILFIGDRNSSSSDLTYFDLNSLKIIYESAFGQFYNNIFPVYFDGEFVHFFGKVFDKKTGMMISNTDKARAYNAVGFSDIKTVYDDSSISVFTAKKDAVAYTVFYDLATGQPVFEIAASATAVVKTQFGYILFDKTTNIVKTVVIS